MLLPGQRHICRTVFKQPSLAAFKLFKEFFRCNVEKFLNFAMAF
jgi:hypothetical protein